MKMASRDFKNSSYNKRFPDNAVSSVEDFVSACVAMGSGTVGIVSFDWHLGSQLVGIGQSGFAIAKYISGQNRIDYLATAYGSKIAVGNISTLDNTVTINWSNT